MKYNNISKLRRNFKNSKRKLASLEECKFDLQKELPILFKAYNEAIKQYNIEIEQTPSRARPRAFEANLFMAKLLTFVLEYFPEEGSFGKYRRFILRLNGYNILIKKLNKKGLPMNIQTKMVEAITNQLQLSLFENDSTYQAVDPILFFGYQRNRIGQLVNPQLVYIDEGKIQWTITENDIEQNININTKKSTSVEPKLRKNISKRRKSSNN